ncbi:hypothetical protein FRC04_011855 [Tulasnella sp. 424]|nr:hypothetical protein FRC04_011855 [Tulasnella sp. 424]KAG8971408.1 hypothetical protein FRC05_011087 [Tulasnella sp. 425]
MKSIAFTSLLLSVFGARSALAVVAEYGQCGGLDYTGDTACTSGLTCVYQNDWYYQCLNAGAATTPTTKMTRAGGRGTPVGFGTSTTGGAGGATVTPTTQAQLITYLSDSTARTIVLTKVFDFTTYYGTTTGPACKPWTCTNGATPQMLLSGSAGGCENLTTYTVTYYTSGSKKNLVVNSNKTLLGQGSSAGMWVDIHSLLKTLLLKQRMNSKGIGLTMNSVSNIIIQNIQITDINPQYVWGGDAIQMSGASKIWIDHNYFARVGRQFIVTGFDPVTQLTISNNYFDGRTSYGCNGKHYWVWLFLGTADRITVMQNHVYSTSGRAPHIGGYSGSNQQLHLVNNYYDTIDGHAIDTDISSHVLAEGNYFKSVTTPDTNNHNGLEYFVQTVADAGACTSHLGRVCEWNRLESSGTVSARLDSSVLSDLAQTVVKSLKPMAVADVPTYVVANAGVGIVN